MDGSIIGWSPKSDCERESDKDAGYIGVPGSVAVEEAGDRLGKVK